MSPEQVFVATARRGQEASPKGNGEGVSSRTSGVNQPRREGQGGCFNYSLLPKTHGHVNSIVPLLHRRDLDAAMSYDDGGGRMLRRGLLQSP
jgi:hypothetical protein